MDVQHEIRQRGAGRDLVGQRQSMPKEGTRHLRHHGVHLVDRGPDDLHEPSFPVSLDLQPKMVVNNDGPVDQQLAVFSQFDVDPVHGARCRPIEIIGVPEVAAAVTGALESRQRGIGPGGLLPRVRVFRNPGTRLDQIAGDVGEISRGAAQMRADQADGVKAIRVAIDDYPLVDDHVGRPDRIGTGRVGLEGGWVLVGGVRLDELDALIESDDRGHRESRPAGDGQEATASHLAAVVDQTPKISGHYTKALWAGGVRTVAKTIVEAMMMTNSVATSRQPKSALIASRTPCTGRG